MWYIKLNNKYRMMSGQWTEKKKNAKQYESKKMAEMIASRIPGAIVTQ